MISGAGTIFGRRRERDLSDVSLISSSSSLSLFIISHGSLFDKVEDTVYRSYLY